MLVNESKAEEKEEENHPTLLAYIPSHNTDQTDCVRRAYNQRIIYYSDIRYALKYANE